MDRWGDILLGSTVPGKHHGGK